MAAGLEEEARAATFLQNCGLVVVDRRWRCPLGELDLVARDGGSVVFVEVKARSSDAFGGGLAAVDGRKRRRLAAAAEVYLAERGLCDAPSRFDVVALTPEGIEHVPDAFRP